MGCKIPWNKGKHLNEEYRQKLSLVNKGNPKITGKAASEEKERLRKSKIVKTMTIIRDNFYKLTPRHRNKFVNEVLGGCSLCGWKEASCDFHHINGRKVEDADGHWNISILCPNCHRKFHDNLLKREDLRSLKEILPEDWKEKYFEWRYENAHIV